MQVDLILSYRNGQGKKQSTTISHANPNVDNEKLRQLAIALNDLTTNIYDQTIKKTEEGL